MQSSTAVTVYHQDDVIGWISRGGCENPACIKADAEGSPFHATPRGFAITLPTYHYDTVEDAITALESVAIMCPHGNLAGRFGGCDRCDAEADGRWTIVYQDASCLHFVGRKEDAEPFGERYSINAREDGRRIAQVVPGHVGNRVLNAEEQDHEPKELCDARH